MPMKIEDVIDLIETGWSGRIGDLSFIKDEGGDILVVGYSDFRNEEFLSKIMALTELEEIKNLFLRIRKENPEFDRYLGNKRLRIGLYTSEGKGAYKICEEIDGVISLFGLLEARS